MNLLVVNLFLAFVWAALVGYFNVYTLVSGYVLGFGVLWICRPIYDVTTNYFTRSFRILQLILFFIWELIVSSIEVARIVLTPWRTRPEPAIVEMPLDVKSDLEILMVSSLISLTPGTLSLDVSDDRSALFVHAMFGENPDQTAAELKAGMEHRVAEVFRL
ncbi:MAG: Na+/H+ antiporter subunit E [Qingshengfaniella sp.]